MLLLNNDKVISKLYGEGIGLKLIGTNLEFIKTIKSGETLNTRVPTLLWNRAQEPSKYPEDEQVLLSVLDSIIAEV